MHAMPGTGRGPVAAAGALLAAAKTDPLLPAIGLYTLSPPALCTSLTPHLAGRPATAAVTALALCEAPPAYTKHAADSRPIVALGDASGVVTVVRADVSSPPGRTPACAAVLMFPEPAGQDGTAGESASSSSSHVTCLCFAARGHWLVGGTERAACAWRRGRDQNWVPCWTQATQGAASLAASPTEPLFVTAAEASPLQVWRVDAAADEVERVHSEPCRANQPGWALGITPVAFAARGDGLAWARRGRISTFAVDFDAATAPPADPHAAAVAETPGNATLDASSPPAGAGASASASAWRLAQRSVFRLSVGASVKTTENDQKNDGANNLFTAEPS